MNLRKMKKRKAREARDDAYVPQAPAPTVAKAPEPAADPAPGPEAGAEDDADFAERSEIVELMYRAALTRAEAAEAKERAAEARAAEVEAREQSVEPAHALRSGDVCGSVLQANAPSGKQSSHACAPRECSKSG